MDVPEIVGEEILSDGGHDVEPPLSLYAIGRIALLPALPDISPLFSFDSVLR